MPAYDSTSLLPITAGLTLLGLVISYLVARKRGAAAAVRPVAWSLVPIGLYLSGLLKFLWTVIDQAVSWVTHLLFSPSVWAGFGVLALAVVLWVIGGMTAARARTHARRAKQEAASGTDRHGPSEVGRRASGTGDPELDALLASTGTGASASDAGRAGRNPVPQARQQSRDSIPRRYRTESVSQAAQNSKKNAPAAGGSSDSDNFDEIEAILKKHGIN